MKQICSFDAFNLLLFTFILKRSKLSSGMNVEDVIYVGQFFLNLIRKKDIR